MNAVLVLRKENKQNIQDKRVLHSQKRRIKREISSLKIQSRKLKEEILDINSRLERIVNDEGYLPSLSCIKQRLTRGVKYLDTRKERIGKDIGRDKVEDLVNKLNSILEQLKKDEKSVQSASLQSIEEDPRG